MSEKTEQPTHRRLERARREGEVARSRVASSAAVVAAGGVALGWTAPAAWHELQVLLQRMLEEPGLTSEPALGSSLRVLARFVLPVALAGALAALLAGLALGGGRFEASVLQPRWERVSPSAGFGRLWTARRLIEPLLALGIALLLALLAWSGFEDQAGRWFRAVRLPGGSAALAALTPVAQLLETALWWLLAVGVLEALWARWRHAQSLRMTREEVRREHQQAEGDPRHKAHRRSAHRQLASGGPARGVHSATAVVVNPTHIAVALRYAPDELEAPYVVGKGREADALVLRAEAKRLGIPIVKDIPLARSLVHLDLGEGIPEELYRAAAAVLATAAQSSPVNLPPEGRTA
jgi:type III secretion protein U